jgi:hypothetical protein
MKASGIIEYEMPAAKKVAEQVFGGSLPLLQAPGCAWHKSVAASSGSLKAM